MNVSRLKLYIFQVIYIPSFLFSKLNSQINAQSERRMNGWTYDDIRAIYIYDDVSSYVYIYMIYGLARQYVYIGKADIFYRETKLKWRRKNAQIFFFFTDHWL